jgi:hypothetical protein
MECDDREGIHAQIRRLNNLPSLLLKQKAACRLQLRTHPRLHNLVTSRARVALVTQNTFDYHLDVARFRRHHCVDAFAVAAKALCELLRESDDAVFQDLVVACPDQHFFDYVGYWRPPFRRGEDGLAVKVAREQGSGVEKGGSPARQGAGIEHVSLGVVNECLRAGLGQ